MSFTTTTTTILSHRTSHHIHPRYLANGSAKALRCSMLVGCSPSNDTNLSGSAHTSERCALAVSSVPWSATEPALENACGVGGWFAQQRRRLIDWMDGRMNGWMDEGMGGGEVRIDEEEVRGEQLKVF
ncbi:hypothetical protein PLESTB_000584500 [Pleodorina starrii]|uniref:Uncharacterized protein n=1 Tax=Pleodorina starrii TaxID=330485 RepID=A0A9W6BHW7_9CHLO|nr:hypothetical protein PLESTM_000299900 [Pleodorina starrii]GLC52115.1 hypothetical protein PLESTB_000584500 [Pleodorina starrii]